MSRDHRLGLRRGRETPPTDLPVRGDLPDWLSGLFLRNGPGQFSVGDRTVNHWFDGFAMLRRFAIRDGAVEFACRFLRSDAREYARARGDLYYEEFGTAPEGGLVGRARRLLTRGTTDNASITIECRDGEFVALTETPRGRAFDPQTLTTLGVREFDDDLAGSTAHRHYDPLRGETLGLARRYGRRSGYVLHRRPDGERSRSTVATVRVDRPAYVHSFALAGRYAVVAEPPAVASPRTLLTADSFADAFEWRPERGLRFFVIDRDAGRTVATRTADPAFVFHHANAVARDGAVVVDCVAFEGNPIPAFALDRLRSPEPDLPTGELRRYRLPLPDRGRGTGASAGGDGTVASRRLHAGPVAFPTIDYAGRNGRPYRYVYCVGNRSRPPETLPNRLVKVDVRAAADRADDLEAAADARAADDATNGGAADDGTSATAVWEEPNAYPGEPVFVPAPADRRDGEDDGVVLSVVLDADAERSFLLVLDAETFEERARALAPVAIPFGFHGQFYRDGGRPIRSTA